MFRFSLVLTLTVASLVPGSARGAQTGFVERSVEVDGETFLFQVFVPQQWTPDEEWPVVFFLHGAGERGEDGGSQTSLGLPPILRDQPDFPAVVVMPQCRRGQWWGEPAMERQAFAALEASIDEFHGDRTRIYLTGLSMGGYGAWAFGYKYPKKFAAIVPVCGGVTSRRAFPVPEWHPASKSPADPYTETARGIGATPIWAFHGDQDRRVPVSESRKLAKALESSGGIVRYTEYPGVAHNSWVRAYAEEELVPWLLSHRLGEN